MCDIRQDVAINVVPPPSPSCLPSSSSDAPGNPAPVTSDPITNFEENTNSTNKRCQRDTPNVRNTGLLTTDEDYVAPVSLPPLSGDVDVAIGADNPKGTICVEAECNHLLSQHSKHGKVDPLTALCEIALTEKRDVSVDDPCGQLPGNNANHEHTFRPKLACTETFRPQASNVSEFIDHKLPAQSESSNSTDGTLRNSEESCESDVPTALTDNIVTQLKTKTKLNMGNKQSGGKQGRGNDDHDGRTQCCDIPKKKVKDKKDKSNRSSRTSRLDDLAFDAAEVYPFDARAMSEHELHEPVELDPFEIVETDDIKFVPGAGTSDVIKSVSEPKFSTIPEEPSHSASFASTSHANQETSLKVPFYIEKGNRLIEPGTSTAHSTFEFKQVKAKSKLVKMTPDPNNHNYENVQLAADTDIGVSGFKNDRKVSNSSSKSGSSSDSKGNSRKNSKDAMQKPLRKGKGKQSETHESPASPSEIHASNAVADVKRKQPKGKKDPAIRDSEIDRKIDSVLMLTQTMFSQTKPPEKSEDQGQSMLGPPTVPGIQYENVGVVAKMESTGIKIVHQEVPVKATKEGCENKTNSNIAQCTDGSNCETQGATGDVAEGSKRKSYPQLSSDIMEISESGTLIIKSLADMPSEKTDSLNSGWSKSITDSDQDTDQTDRKFSYDTIDNERNAKGEIVQYESIDECKSNNHVTNDDKDKLNVNQINDTSKSPTVLEDVPPPSPTAMDAFVEEEEEYDEDYDYDDEEEAKRQSAEIVEFTENVCKRLSQLLILEGHQEEDEVDDEEHSSNTMEKKYADHIYETIDGKYRIVDGKPTVLGEQTDTLKFIDEDSLNNSLKLSTRSESTGTLKRTSGDSETYQRVDETRETFSEDSSNDDMPSYFDPSEKSIPHTDSEIVCSVLDSYECGRNDDNNVSKNVISKQTNLEGGSYDNVNLESNDKKSKNYKTNKATFEGGSYDNVDIDNDDVVSNNFKSSKTNFEGGSYDNVNLESEDNVVSEPLKTFDLGLINTTPSTNKTEDLQDRTPTAEAQPNLTPLTELANVEVDTPLQYETSGRHSVTCTESDLDISEHRDDLSTDSMLADDEAEETMEILFTKTYTEPVEGAEVFLSCTVVNSAYKEEKKKSETWLSDEALEYLEANASEVMSTAFLKAKKEMKDIQVCLQSLRQQMEHFHSDCDDVSLPDIPVDSLSPDYFGIPHRKAITD